MAFIGNILGGYAAREVGKFNQRLFNQQARIEKRNAEIKLATFNQVDIPRIIAAHNRNQSNMLVNFLKRGVDVDECCLYKRECRPLELDRKQILSWQDCLDLIIVVTSLESFQCFQKLCPPKLYPWIYQHTFCVSSQRIGDFLQQQGCKSLIFARSARKEDIKELIMQREKIILDN